MRVVHCGQRQARRGVDRGVRGGIVGRCEVRGVNGNGMFDGRGRASLRSRGAEVCLRFGEILAQNFRLQVSDMAIDFP